MEQAHEQNNMSVKIDGGAIGTLKNDQAILKWALAGPSISDILLVAIILTIKTEQILKRNS